VGGREKKNDDEDVNKKVDELMNKHKPRPLTDEERREMMDRLRAQYGNGQ